MTGRPPGGALTLKPVLPRAPWLLWTLLGPCAATLVSGTTASGQGVPQHLELRPPETAHTDSLRFRRLLRLGSPDRPEDAFGYVWDVAIDSRQRVYVLDRSVWKVLIFDSLGQRVGEAGGKGSGPGEFRDPWRMTIGVGDTILVYDVGNSRLSFFSSDGRYVRSVTLRPRTSGMDLAELPGGRILVSGLDRASHSILHVYSRDGVRLRSFATADSLDLAGYEESLLGGHVDLTPNGMILFSRSTPYELMLFDAEGRLTWSCRDPTTRLSNPSDVVVVQGERRGLLWNRFVQSASVFALRDTLFLNIVTDPVNDRRQFDLVSRRCVLLSRRIVDAPLLLTKRDPARRRFIGGLNLEVPEVLVYVLSF